MLMTLAGMQFLMLTAAEPVLGLSRHPDTGVEEIALFCEIVTRKRSQLDRKSSAEY